MQTVQQPNYQQAYSKIGSDLGNAIKSGGEALDKQKQIDYMNNLMKDQNRFKATMANAANYLMQGQDYTEDDRQSVLAEIKATSNPKEVAAKLAEFKQQVELHKQAQAEGTEAVLPKPEWGYQAKTYQGFLKTALKGPRARKMAGMTQGGPQPQNVQDQSNLQAIGADQDQTNKMNVQPTPGKPQFSPQNQPTGISPDTMNAVAQDFGIAPIGQEPQGEPMDLAAMGLQKGAGAGGISDEEMKNFGIKTLPPAVNTSEAANRIAQAGMDPNSPEAKAAAISPTEARQTQNAMQPIGVAQNQRQAVTGAINAQGGEMSKTAELAAKTVPTEQQQNVLEEKRRGDDAKLQRQREHDEAMRLHQKAMEGIATLNAKLRAANFNVHKVKMEGDDALKIEQYIKSATAITAAIGKIKDQAEIQRDLANEKVVKIKNQMGDYKEDKAMTQVLQEQFDEAKKVVDEIDKEAGGYDSKISEIEAGIKTWKTIQSKIPRVKTAQKEVAAQAPKKKPNYTLTPMP
jgi:hypothetical protein